MQDKTPNIIDLVRLLESEDKEGIAEFITSFRTEWNRLVAENEGLKEKLRISGVNLSGKDLSGVSFRGVEIEDTDLSDTDLSGVDLTDANISRTDLSGSRIYFAKLERAHITQTDFTGARIYSVSFDKAYVTGSANLMEAYIAKQEKSLEETYRTHPAVTREGFQMKEAYEHRDEDEDKGY